MSESTDRLAAAAKKLRTTLESNGDWDDGCFYYNKHAAPELQSPMRRLDEAFSAYEAEAEAREEEMRLLVNCENLLHELTESAELVDSLDPCFMERVHGTLEKLFNLAARRLAGRKEKP